MKDISSHSPITGIVPPIVTPLLDNNTLDIAGLERLIEHLIAGGVSGLFILGTTGEAHSLSPALRKKMLQECCRITNKRIPILACISDTSLQNSIDFAHTAASFGADAVVSTAPYYYNQSQPELIEYYDALIPQLPLPIYLYNMPSHTKVSFDPQTVQRIAQHEKVIGLKDSSCNGVYLQSVMFAMSNHNNFSILVGPEEMMGEHVLIGGDGGVNGGANLFPELYVALYDAAKKGNIARVKELQQVVMYISTHLYCIGKYNSSLIKGIKCSLSLMGICNDYIALPYQRFEITERNKVQKVLQHLSQIPTLTDLCKFTIKT